MQNYTEVFIKAAAVNGILMLWARITIEALKFSWHIISTSPEKVTWEPVRKVMCEECNEFFSDDGDVLEHGKFLCEYCSDQLEK